MSGKDDRKKGLGRKGEDLQLLICRCASILAFLPLSIGVCVCVCVCMREREREWKDIVRVSEFFQQNWLCDFSLL